MSPVLPILRGDNKVALSCKLRDGLSVTEVPRCKGKQKSRKSKTFGLLFDDKVLTTLKSSLRLPRMPEIDQGNIKDQITVGG